jgi:hypothetical protein
VIVNDSESLIDNNINIVLINNYLAGWLIEVQKCMFAFLISTKKHEPSQSDPRHSRDEARK